MMVQFILVFFYMILLKYSYNIKQITINKYKSKSKSKNSLVKYYLNLLYYSQPLFIKNLMSSEKQFQNIISSQQQQQQQQQEQDDLLMFEQIKRMKIMKENNIGFPEEHQQLYTFDNKGKNIIGNVQSENQEQEKVGFNKFYGNKKSQIQSEINKKDKNTSPQQINQQQLSAKKLRAFNAAKYFQKIKLNFLKQVFNLSRELNQISNYNNQQYHSHQMKFNRFLSMIKGDILIKCFKIKNKNLMTVSDAEVLDVFREVFTIENMNRFQEINKESLNEEKKNQVHEEDQDFMKTEQKKTTKSQLMYKLAQFLNCKIKRINFFNIQNFVDQSFYNLDYEKNEKRAKKKKTSKLQDQIKNKITRQIYQHQIQDKDDYVDLNNFSFNEVIKTLTKSEEEIDRDIKQSKNRSKKIQQIKKYFLQQTYQIFSFGDKKWKIFMSIHGHFEQLQLQWFKQNILTGMPIIGFFSTQTLRPLNKYKQLFQLREMSNFVIKDLSMFFCDSWRKLTARKKRVGVRILMNKIYRFCNFKKPLDLLQTYEAFQYQHTIKSISQTLVANQIPKSNLQFTFNDHFITPSRVGKYHILSPEAKPIQNVEDYNDQKIYWKDDLIPVCSRMGWIDFARMIVEGAQPLKRTQNRNKKPIQLYRYQQTKPFELQVDASGNFILDPQHNSIYIPPKLQLPVDTCIVKEKISFICNKHKFIHAKLVQGFTHTGGMRILPNEIGYLIYAKDKQQILKLYEERQQLLNRNKESKYDQKMQKMWRQVLKYVKLVDRMGGQLSTR